MKNDRNYEAGLCIYCIDREKMISECKNPIIKGDFKWILHHNWKGTKQLRITMK